MISTCLILANLEHSALNIDWAEKKTFNGSDWQYIQEDWLLSTRHNRINLWKQELTGLFFSFVVEAIQTELVSGVKTKQENC